ncbi:MAG: DUF1365 family protein, partial [Bdellovibrionales bacterium]|nr:DUF1365 family protein [Bdellovibrionales bacterium]
MKSAIFVGNTYHYRRTPREHSFTYPMPMLFLALDD